MLRYATSSNRFRWLFCNGSSFYCQTAPISFNLYDNEEKGRLRTTYQTRVEAENECQRLNLMRLESFLSECESLQPL